MMCLIKSMARRRDKQLAIEFRTHGGKRKGAGRKRDSSRPGVSHRARSKVSGREPLHVTMKVTRAAGHLRFKERFRAVRSAIRRGKERPGFRVVHFSVQGDHVHLIVEADDNRSLSRGMQSLAVRIWWALRHATRLQGKAFADRYHVRVLRTPREVRAAILYVLQNGRKHSQAGLRAGAAIDPCSSGAYFDGWKAPVSAPGDDAPVASPKTWLLRIGWQKHGLISANEAPKADPR